MNAISPGVYVSIIPLSSYVQQVPGDNGFIAVLSDKGPDGQMLYFTSEQQLLTTFGNPDYNNLGTWAQGMLVADNYIKVAGSLYAIRVLPPTATYANSMFFITKLRSTSLASGLSVYTALSSQVVSLQDVNAISTSTGTASNLSSLLEAFSSSLNTNTIPIPQYMNLIPKYGTIVNGVYNVLTVQNGELTLVVSNTNCDNPIYVADTSQNVWSFNYSTLSFTSTTYTYNAQTDVLPPVYISNIDNTILYQLNVDSTNTPNYTLTPVTTNVYISALYDIFQPLYGILGAGRGSYYNNYQLQVSVPTNATYPSLSLYLNQNGTYYNTMNIPFSFQPTQLDANGISVYIGNTISYAADLQLYLNNETIASTTQTYTDTVLNQDSEGNYTVSNVMSVTGLLQTPPTNPTNGQTYLVLANGTGVWFGQDGTLATWSSTTNTWSFSSAPVPANQIVVSGNNLYINLSFGQVFPFDPYTFVAIDQNAIQNNLSNGSSGTLKSGGQVNATVATELLSQAYSGLIDPNVTNTDNYWFDLVLDAGYPQPVKDSIVELVSVLRNDCVALLDLTYNTSEESAYNNRIQNFPFDTMYAAIYDPYVQIYDNFSGQTLWVTPIYEVAPLIAQNDMSNYVWYAVAGETRGVINNALQLAYNPNLSQRDVLYLNQINPIVQFQGSPTMIYGQLTSQMTAYSTNNLNVVRTTLYIQRGLSQYCKQKIFDFNDPITYNNMTNDIKAFLQDIEDERGLTSYSVSVSATALNLQQKSATVSVSFTVNSVIEKFFLNLYVQ